MVSTVNGLNDLKWKTFQNSHLSFQSIFLKCYNLNDLSSFSIYRWSSCVHFVIINRKFHFFSSSAFLATGFKLAFFAQLFFVYYFQKSICIFQVWRRLSFRLELKVVKVWGLLLVMKTFSESTLLIFLLLTLVTLERLSCWS